MSKRNGQTLLELVIAAGVISTATIAAITLIVRTITIGQVGQSKVEAINYAREGIEVVRMVRDSNWLKADNNITKPDAGGTPLLTGWDDTNSYGHQVSMGADAATGAVVAAGVDYTVQFRPSSMTSRSSGWWLAQCGSAASGCPVTDNRTYVWICTGYDSNGGTGTVPPTECTGGTRTRYHRVIHITQVTDSVTIGSTAYPTTYLDVTSTVSWKNGSNDSSIVERTRLYNWR